jgi:hypothetical protein
MGHSLASLRLSDAPGENALVRFKDGMGQRFLLTVDTEEEFDWTKPLRASGHTVDTVGWITKFQEFCGGFGVVPVYLIDYPIATSPLAAEVLREPLAQGKAEIGVQLHPGSTRRMRKRSTSTTASRAIFPTSLNAPSSWSCTTRSSAISASSR